jgi:hypothetical protein
MLMPDLIIRADPEDLAELFKAIDEEVGPDARLFPVTEAEPVQLREPFTIALIVALGGPTIIKSITGVINRYFEHKEKMYSLAIIEGDRERPTTLGELTAT